MFFRIQYARWKDECHHMFPVVGSGRYVTAPIITEEGNPILDPLVLQQTKTDVGAVAASSSNGSVAKSSASTVRIFDKKEIQWKLTLHQIGQLSYSFFLKTLSAMSISSLALQTGY